MAEHFWSKVKRSKRCWLWIAARRPAGYGTYYVKRVPMLAHRVAWELTYGPIPQGAYVLHHCDNPPCVRPEHLFLGSAALNITDSQQKGRRPMGSSRVRGTGRAVGERHPSAKLTEQDVREARLAYRAGTPIPELAKRYGINQAPMRAACTGITWKHVK